MLVRRLEMRDPLRDDLDGSCAGRASGAVNHDLYRVSDKTPCEPECVGSVIVGHGEPPMGGRASRSAGPVGTHQDRHPCDPVGPVEHWWGASGRWPGTGLPVQLVRIGSDSDYAFLGVSA